MAFKIISQNEANQMILEFLKENGFSSKSVISKRNGQYYILSFLGEDKVMTPITNYLNLLKEVLEIYQVKVLDGYPKVANSKNFIVAYEPTKEESIVLS